MKLEKCPRCELNYMRPGESLCDVCKRELGKKSIQEEETPEICPSCNERPVEPGEELCKVCLRDAMRLENAELIEDDEDEEEEDGADDDLDEEDDLDPDDLADIDIDSLDDEVLDDEIPASDLSDIESDFNLGEEAEDFEDEEL